MSICLRSKTFGLKVNQESKVEWGQKTFRNAVDPLRLRYLRKQMIDDLKMTDDWLMRINRCNQNVHLLAVGKY